MAAGYALLIWVLLASAVSGSPLGCDPPKPEQRLVAYGSFNYTHRIRTSRPEAQSLFDQGVLLAAGFNQAEAAAAFVAAISFDHLCAMCWWGLAYARAPFQNKPAVPPPTDPAAAVYPRYRRSEMEAALAAIRVAAALTGLVRPTDFDAAVAAANASLPVAAAAPPPPQESNGTAAAAGALRLMERLNGCPPTYGKPATGAGRRQQRRRAAAEGAAEGSVDAPAAAATAAAARSLLARERHYVAAMADRLAVRETWGERWQAAERRYAQDMADIAGCFPDDADAPALAAEALANTVPWDFWDPVTDSPREPTPMVLALLNESLSRDPLQPLALHLHIHVTEALPAGRGPTRAGLAEASADSLMGLLPAWDHLQHMPSHTFVRVGRWADSVQSNIASLRASVRASHACLASTYPDHNAAMLVFGASMGADLQTAATYARFAKELPRFVRDAPARLGVEWVAPLPVWVRFAQWHTIMQAPPPPAADGSAGGGGGNATAGGAGGGAKRPDVAADPFLDPALRYTAAQGGNGTGPGPFRGPIKDTEYTQEGADFARVWWHFARAMALAAQDVPAKPGQGLGIDVPGYKMLSLVLRLVGKPGFAEARLALLDGQVEPAAEALGRAAEAEAGGGYFEPPRLGPQPARQCLGWVLLRAGRLREALQTYLEDLAHYPANPWSVRGLHAATPLAQKRLADLQVELAAADAAAAAAAAGGGTASGTSTVAAADAAAKAAKLRGDVEGLEGALKAAAAAVAEAGGAAGGAGGADGTTGALRSSCLAFSEHGK
ncbi:hypothetical protein GPECTOR_47g312 [Gonium pectorale]|uniref:Uncharacterized protein n=1 Tax=Gonium pectorale TaxID=33097 RepID=A0A150G863_GONPE|nr:hypothetical protein GPECTOR_47g312 [Gonium pectorale]|eukprot:KXZ46037.1 hypothetical protein GPECTOR_47g312 [Gonium pectorale]